MTTRHLYELEDVAGTLVHAIHVAEHRVAVLAARELYVSEEPELLFKVLTLAWVLCDPSHPYQHHRWVAYVANDAQALLGALLTTTTCVELPPLHTSGPSPPVAAVGSAGAAAAAAEPPKEWSTLPSSWSRAQAGILWHAVRYALRNKYWQHAAYMIRPLLNQHIRAASSLLRALGVDRRATDAIEITVFAPLAERMLDHALAALVAEPAAGYAPHPLMTTLWQKVPRGRTFTVDAAAMGVWRIGAKGLGRLVGNPVQICEPDASAYWKRLVTHYACTVVDGALQCANDDSTEEFYRVAFPSDIPDEWSCAERAKSHGIAAVAGTEPNPWRAAFILCWS